MICQGFGSYLALLVCWCVGFLGLDSKYSVERLLFSLVISSFHRAGFPQHRSAGSPEMLYRTVYISIDIYITMTLHHTTLHYTTPHYTALHLSLIHI